MALDQLDDPLQRRPVDHRAGRVVRIGEADQAGLGPQGALEPLEVELPAVLEAQLEPLDLGPERGRRLEVGGVVGARDQGVLAGAEKRGRDHEQRRGGPGGDEHVVGLERRPVGGDHLAQARKAAVVAVLEQQIGDVGSIP